MTDLHVVMPGTVDREDRPSGGNTYDRRICTDLRALGWVVHEHPLHGAWPQPDAEALAALARVVDALPEGTLTMVDGLIASCTADVLVPRAQRLRLVVLVHMPLGLPASDGAALVGGASAAADEKRVLTASVAVVTTSEWTRRWLIDHYRLSPDRIHVARPGVDAAALAPGTPSGGRLLCVAAVTPSKGHDRLLTALAALRDLPWRCVCAGAMTLDPDYVDALGDLVRDLGLAERVHFVGSLSRHHLDREYAAADLLVLASRAETYGMVVVESLARGVPVIATSVGGLPEAMGTGVDGSPPGLLVDPGDPEALAGALRAWLSDADLRARLRALARGRRETLSGWAETSRDLAAVLSGVSE